jgi:hypothetical protein
VSLINDALRKARQAAAEHEARQPETAFRAPKAYPSRGPRRRGGVVLLVLVAATAGLTGAALVWWTLDKGESAVAALDQPVADSTRETVADSQPVSMIRSIENPPADLGGHAGNPQELRTNGAEVVDEEAVRGQTAGAANPPGGQSAAAPLSAPRKTPEEPPVHEQLAAGQRVFVLDADLGYASLSLGFIVARPVRPFAEINDIEVYVGSEVAGFVVEQIEPDQVTLRDARGELVLKVR